MNLNDSKVYVQDKISITKTKFSDDEIVNETVVMKGFFE
jgi:hypothetical protein